MPDIIFQFSYSLYFSDEHFSINLSEFTTQYCYYTCFKICLIITICASPVDGLVANSFSCWLFCGPCTVAHRAPVCGISQARILEWVAIFSPRASSWPWDRTCASYFSCIGRQVLYHLSHQASASCIASLHLEHHRTQPHYPHHSPFQTFLAFKKGFSSSRPSPSQRGPVNSFPQGRLKTPELTMPLTVIIW